LRTRERRREGTVGPFCEAEGGVSWETVDETIDFAVEETLFFLMDVD
jgi:hypothetical protein